MTTSTTDAEAIARIIDPSAFNPDAQTIGKPAYWEAKREWAVRTATAILSYLASRREAIANDDIADALERCDWSGAPIGNKAIIASAIERLRENVLFCEDAADHLALIDYISDKIGLPKDEELSRENFAAWLSASRREAQEPVAWRVTYADGGTVYLHHKPTGDSGVYECTPLYTAPPAPAGEVERLRAAIKRQVENIDRWRETGEPASPEESKSIYEQLVAALNGCGHD